MEKSEGKPGAEREKTAAERQRSREEIYSGRLGHFGVETVELPNGNVVRLEILRHPGAAAVVPLHEDGTVTLIRQYRHAGGGFILEIPAGKLDAGEDPLDCGRRELREETGLTATEIVPLLPLLTTPAFTDEVIHLYLARGLTEGESALEADEVVTTLRIPLSEACEKIRRGEIRDGKTVVALLLVAERERSKR